MIELDKIVEIIVLKGYLSFSIPCIKYHSLLGTINYQKDWGKEEKSFLDIPLSTFECKNDENQDFLIFFSKLGRLKCVR